MACKQLGHKLFAEYKPHSKQLEFHASKSRFKALTAGARSGKTYAAAREFIRHIYQDSYSKTGPLRYWVIAPTYGLLEVAQREIATVLLQRPADTPEPSWLIKNWDTSMRRLSLFGRITISFRSASRPELLVAEGLDGVWIDECARMKADAWRGNLRIRLSDKHGWGIFSTTPLGTNWYYHDIFARGDRQSKFYDPEYHNFHFKTVDNTSVPGLAEEVKKAKRQLPLSYFKREYEASFENFVGQIYEELDAEIHLIEKLPPQTAFTHYTAGMDFGWRQGALIIVGQTVDNDWIVVQEYIAERLVVVAGDHGVRSWATEIKSLLPHYPGITIWGDSADPEAIMLLRRAGVPIRKAQKEVLRGIELVSSLLHPQGEKKPRLRFLSRVPRCFKQMQLYRWDEYRGQIIDRPAPGQEDHAPDALRYALYSEFKRNSCQTNGRPVNGF